MNRILRLLQKEQSLELKMLYCDQFMRPVWQQELSSIRRQIRDYYEIQAQRDNLKEFLR